MCVKEMDWCEMLAKAIIEQVIAGSKMLYRSEQSHSEYDFDLVYPDGRKAAVEVTAAKDKPLEDLKGAINDEKKGGRIVPRKSCSNDWMVIVSQKANINRIRENIDVYLADVEKEGKEKFNAHTDYHDSQAVHRILKDLQVEFGTIVELDRPGIFISGPILETTYNPKEVDRAVLCEAWKEDNRKKLRLSEHVEKHMFICIDSGLWRAWYAINKHKPSDLPVELPPEIDIV